MRAVEYQSNADAWSASHKKSEYESATAEEVADTMSRFQMTALAVGDQGLEYMPRNLTLIADLRTTVAGREIYNAFGLNI
jgi:ABC-type molybdate transport system ATPase subunit